MQSNNKIQTKEIRKIIFIYFIFQYCVIVQSLCLKTATKTATTKRKGNKRYLIVKFRVEANPKWTKNMSNSSSADASAPENCENCSSSFSLFKRKVKILKIIFYIWNELIINLDINKKKSFLNQRKYAICVSRPFVSRVSIVRQLLRF